jgi:hypothetical protein
MGRGKELIGAAAEASQAPATAAGILKFIKSSFVTPLQ